MRSMLITAAWCLCVVLALASLSGYGAAKAAVHALDELRPNPFPAPAVRPADQESPLLSFVHLVEYLDRRADWTPSGGESLAAILVGEGVRSGVDPRLLAAVIEVESGFRADAVGLSGEIGLMQILPSTARRIARTLGLDDFSEDGLFDPALNVRLGAAHLRALLDQYQGDEVAALTAYNAGRSTSATGLRYAYRVLAVADRVPADVRPAWTSPAAR